MPTQLNAVLNDALFNRFTGFEIVERELGLPEYVLPMLCRAGKQDRERSEPRVR